MTNKKPFHHGDLRRALISTALGIIREHGVEAVTMRGLSQAVGVSRTAAYRHFEDKRDLLYAVAEEGYRAIAQVNVKLAAKADPNALVTLEAFGRAYLGLALENPELYRLMFGSDLMGDDRPKSVVKVTDRAFGALLDTFRRGQAQGLIRPGNVFAMASVMWSTMHGLACLLMDGQLHAYVRDHGGMHLPPDDRAHPQEVTRVVCDLAMKVVLRGVAVSPGETGPE